MTCRTLILVILSLWLAGAASAKGGKLTIGQEAANNRRQQLIQLLQNHARATGQHFDNGILNNKKSGLELMALVNRYRKTMSNDEQEELRKLLVVPPFQTHRVIGHYDIYYDTTGENEPALLDSNFNDIPGTAEMYIDSVGKYFNMAWAVEVDSMGYPPPPFQGSNTHYVVQVLDLGTSLYSQTLWGDTDLIGPYLPSGPSRYATFIQIDNDYQGFYSQGIAGLKVASAHEVQHSITIGNFGFWDGEIYFYELCATWMETKVHPEVPDYLQYLTDQNGNPIGQFGSPDVTFVLSDGLIEFSRVVWAKYFEKRFSRNFMRHVWAYVPTNHTIPSMDKALNDSGSSFRQAFIEWGDWNYHTGLRADTVKYYTEGRIFPEIVTRSPLQFQSPKGDVLDSLQAISCVYQPVYYTSDFLERITNVNLSNPVPTTASLTYTLQLNNSGGGGYTAVGNGLYVFLDVPDPANWSTVATIPASPTGAVAYPDPYISAPGAQLQFMMPQTSSTSASLFVMSSGKRLVYNGQFQISNATLGVSTIAWNGQDQTGAQLASGIYIFVIQVDNNTYTGKFAAVRK